MNNKNYFSKINNKNILKASIQTNEYIQSKEIIFLLNIKCCFWYIFF